MKKSYLFLYSLLCTFFFVSCSEEETKFPGESGFIEMPDDGQGELILTDSMIYNNVLELLLDEDTLENGEIKRTISSGQVLHETHPTEYYLIADSVEEAFDYFKAAFVPFNLEDSLRQISSGTWQLNTIGGSLTFHSESTVDGLAFVDVCLKDVPEVTRFIFITRDEWPKNDVDGSAFTMKQLLYCKTNGYVYFCVRGCEESADGGLLVTFDGGWGNDVFERAAKSKYYNYTSFSLKYNCIEKKDFEALRRVLRNYPTEINEKLDNAEEHGWWSNRTILALRAITNKRNGKFIFQNHDWKHHWGEWWSDKYGYYIVTRYYYDSSKDSFTSKTYGKRKPFKFWVGHPEWDEGSYSGSSKLIFDAVKDYTNNGGDISINIGGKRYVFTEIGF